MPPRDACLDLTSDLGVPVIVALSRDRRAAGSGDRRRDGGRSDRDPTRDRGGRGFGECGNGRSGVDRRVNRRDSGCRFAAWLPFAKAGHHGRRAMTLRACGLVYLSVQSLRADVTKFVLSRIGKYHRSMMTPDLTVDKRLFRINRGVAA